MANRKHSEIIKKWADGAVVQLYNSDHKKWDNCTCPMFNDEEVYRIQPNTLRVALHRDGAGSNIAVMWHENFDGIEKYDSFIRWLTDEVDYEV